MQSDTTVVSPLATVSLPVRGRVAAVGGGSAGANRAAALCQRLAGRRTRTSAVPTAPSSAQLLICPALQMAVFNLRLVAAESSRCPYCSTVHCLLQDLNGGSSLCQDVLDGVHVPAEPMRQYEGTALPFQTASVTTTKVGLESEVSPLLADDHFLRRAPPTLFLTFEYDVLMDDRMAYRKRLLDGGSTA
ncbi:LOW QUALITY PROTEIN: arylacetamide deacetylase-like 4 [Nelusetta ayraudi]|uniref:LOW QUALITY PROTEIN: arylacetamide deacetylase-like 4 n=1 Tax=Nelusetta ayraudi TaxID=303726 RepID=UPI003F6E9EEB